MKAIEIKNVNVKFDANVVLDNIDLDIEKGKIIAIIGPNGSGKTTLLKAILGLIEYEGKIKVLNKNIKKVLGKTAYVPQRFEFDKNFPITVLEFLKLFAAREKTIKSKLKEVGMQDFEKHLLGDLSGGELQRVLIARALLKNPEILLLDEPASGIDIGGEQNIYELVSDLTEKYQSTTILVSHEIEVVYQFADEVVCLNKKLVCKGLPEKVITAETLKKLYGEKATIYPHKEKHKL